MERHRTRHRGVTLLELVVTVAIAAILSIIAVPSFRQLTERSRITAQVNGLLGDFQMARQRAVQTARRITICPLDATGACTPSSDWHEGWVVFRNDRFENPPVVDPQDHVIRVHRLHTDALKLRANRNFFTFRPLGSAVAGSIEICSSGSQPGRVLIVSRIGRVRASDKTAENQEPSCGE